MKTRMANATICTDGIARGSYNLAYVCFKNGHNAGYWEKLDSDTTVEEARARIDKWAEDNHIVIIGYDFS